MQLEQTYRLKIKSLEKREKDLEVQEEKFGVEYRRKADEMENCKKTLLSEIQETKKFK